MKKKRKRKEGNAETKKKKRRKKTAAELNKLEQRVGFLCPYCPNETDPAKDGYRVRVYASNKSNSSFDVNPEGMLNTWSNYHRKLMHTKEPAYPGGLTYVARKKNAETGVEEVAEVFVNRSNCLDFYQTFEYTNKEWSRINGLKRKQTRQYNKKQKESQASLSDKLPSNNKDSTGVKQTDNLDKDIHRVPEKQLTTPTSINKRRTPFAEISKPGPTQRTQDFKAPVAVEMASSENRHLDQNLGSLEDTAPRLTKRGIKLLAEEIKSIIMPANASLSRSPTDGRLNQVIESHERSLRELLNQLSQVISAEQERQHLVKFERPLTSEDIQFYSNDAWKAAKDIGDLLKLVPTSYFDSKPDDEFGVFKLACYEGVTDSLTFPSSGLRVSSKRLLDNRNFQYNKTLRNAFTTFKSRLKKRLWDKENDFFDQHEAYVKTNESKSAKESREDKVLRLKCMTFLKLIFEQRSYVSFEREMYYLSHMGFDVGTIDQSTYFVNKCLDTLANIIKKATRDEFCKFDEVTQSFPDFSMAADGLTDRERSGELVVLTKFCGGKLVNFPVHLKKHKRAKNIGPDSAGLIRHFELALGAADVAGENRLFENLVSTVLDGSEQFKVEFALVEKILELNVEDTLTKRIELPEANIVEWCKVHSWELVAKDLISIDPMVSALEKRVKALRRYLGFGKGADFLEDACSSETDTAKNPKFLKLCKTRFSEHHLKAYRNSFQRLPQLSSGLLNATRKKQQRRQLQKQIISKSVVACNYGIATLFQIIANNSKSLQDEKQPPWVFVKKYDGAIRKLSKMVNDLRTKTKITEIFEEFPDLVDRLTIFTEGVETFRTTNAQGDVVEKEFPLGDASPSWLSHPEWLDEDDWTEQSESESDSETENKAPIKKKLRKKKRSAREKLSLTPDELYHIRTEPEDAELEIKGTDNNLVNYVAKRLLILVIRMRKIAEIRVGKRIRKIHRVSLCHDFENLFTKENNWADFTAHELSGIQELVKLENQYLRLKKGQKEFSWRIIRGQTRKVRDKLFFELQRQNQMKEEILTIQSKGKYNSLNKRKLNSVEKKCWWERINGIWVLRQMKVVAYIRSTKEVWEGCEQYVRILSRSCLRKPAQTHVESLISVVGNHNRGQDWDKVLTEIQLRSIGPCFHECNSLVEKIVKLLRKNSAVRALLKRPEARARRNPEIKVSSVVDRQMAETSVFQGLTTFLD